MDSRLVLFALYFPAQVVDSVMKDLNLDPKNTLLAQGNQIKLLCSSICGSKIIACRLIPFHTLKSYKE